MELKTFLLIFHEIGGMFKEECDMQWKLEKNGLEVLCGILMLVGVILGFFYLQLGGLFVGLSFGLFFATEIQGYFVKARDYYTADGLIRTLLLLGVILYL